MVLEYIKSDLYRYAGKTDFKTFLKYYFAHRGFNFSVWYRLVSRGSLRVKKLALPIYKHKRTKYGISIPQGCKIGYGLLIHHGGPIVINWTTTIGDNVDLRQFTTIGESNFTQTPKIGSYVSIGANVCIIGDVNIGSYVTIGAGSVVTKDIPDYATAAGNYAKVLNYDDKSHYIRNPWPLKNN